MLNPNEIKSQGKKKKENETDLPILKWVKIKSAQLNLTMSFAYRVKSETILTHKNGNINDESRVRQMAWPVNRVKFRVALMVENGGCEGNGN